MKHITLRSIIVASGIFFTSVSLQAIEFDHKDLDLNIDGKVTESEIIAVVQTHFLKNDSDLHSAPKPSKNVWEEEVDLH